MCTFDKIIKLYRYVFGLLIRTILQLHIAVADPGFPRGGGANPKGGGGQPIIWPIFAENCMKMKKFWARGGGASLAPPLDPPLHWCNISLSFKIYRVLLINFTASESLMFFSKLAPTHNTDFGRALSFGYVFSLPRDHKYKIRNCNKS